MSKNIYNQKDYLPRHKRVKKIMRLRFIPFLICSFIFIGIIIYCSLKIFDWYLDNKDIEKINEEIKDDVPIRENTDQGEYVNPDADKNSDYWYYVNIPFYEVDFDTLLKKNPDTVAFIHMENTNINYPVVYSGDNKFYLTHAFDKSYNDAGWVFMDYRNNLDNLSDNTVIYGHGRLNKTVFGSLKNTLTKEWQSQKDNYIIWLSTPKVNMMFQIFSIYTIPSESYYITTSFPNEDNKVQWLNVMKSRNQAPINPPVSIDDHILTLSTCLNNNGGRIVVQAKLIKKQTR